jgi:ribosomal protein S18 acetylase RimI-like enzyme
MNEELRKLIQQTCSADRNLVCGDVDTYTNKLFEKAEFLVSSESGKVKGFVAFYCNDQQTRIAFISFVVTSPEFRGKGLAKSLVKCILDIAQERGFAKCQLKVNQDNFPAIALYRTLKFSLVEVKKDKILMEISL